MANLVLMPQMGISEESAILARWHKQKGDTVQVGDVLFSIETGKSAFDIEAECAGVVLELLAAEGDEVLIKVPVCAIGEQGEVYQAVATSAAAPAEAPVAKAAAAAAPVASPTATRSADDHTGVSPRAKRLAAAADIDPTQAVASGPSGRIIERDVRHLMDSGLPAAKTAPTPVVTAAPAPTTAVFEDKPLSNMRKVISKNMMASLTQTAQLTHTASFDATAIQQYRAFVKNDAELSGITLTDMILYAVSRTLLQFPALNAWLTGDTMRYFQDVNLACAVDTDKGLMVPVIFGASAKSLQAISTELKQLAEGCRAGTVPVSQLSGGSFTVSNLGGFGIESFTPILNAPQTGILGVNTITQRIREVNGNITTYPCMTLSLTYDHRALDGAPASKFLQQLCKNLEKFPVLLARG